MGWNLDDYFESIHNYVSLEDNIVRNGAVSAKKGEKVIIPINMKDGCILGVGFGNPDWNYSAPHGAGRVMFRKEAFEQINLDDYRKSVENVYSTTVNDNTKDESPFVYRDMNTILQNIFPSVKPTNILKSVYNFKVSDTYIDDVQKDNSVSSKSR